MNEVKNKKEENDRKLKEFDNKINNIDYEIRMKDSRYKFLLETEKEKEGYTKSVKSLLLECEKDNILKKGVHRSSSKFNTSTKRI